MNNVASKSLTSNTTTTPLKINTFSLCFVTSDHFPIYVLFGLSGARVTSDKLVCKKNRILLGIHCPKIIYVLSHIPYVQIYNSIISREYE